MRSIPMYLLAALLPLLPAKQRPNLCERLDDDGRTLEVFDVALTPQDIVEIDAVLTTAGGVPGPVYGTERDRNGRHGHIMRYNLNQP